ncbi:EutP/PduV family microcompartment system protein [Endozoicomonas sp. Mp262]|uniref:EutP/PduV family microcompartment system protein n=1 Tax=Endozoicomonas sp. Mp262 TaxID=2919499 RepID=UPI0021E0CA74
MMLVGSTTSGKTTLTQALYGQALKYKKTQALEYSQYILDTPGEFVENRRFFAALMSASVDYKVIGLVHDCTRKQNQIPPGFASMFNREMIGIITKIDSDKADPGFSHKVLKQQFPQTRFRLAHFQLIKNDFIADEQSQTAAISAVGFNDR